MVWSVLLVLALIGSFAYTLASLIKDRAQTTQKQSRIEKRFIGWAGQNLKEGDPVVYNAYTKLVTKAPVEADEDGRE